MKNKPITYHRYRSGLFFPKFKSKPSYKKFDGKRFKLDSWSTNKQLALARKKTLKESGEKVRVVKGRRLYVIWRRMK